MTNDDDYFYKKERKLNINKTTVEKFIYTTSQLQGTICIMKEMCRRSKRNHSVHYLHLAFKKKKTNRVVSATVAGAYMRVYNTCASIENFCFAAEKGRPRNATTVNVYI